MVTVRFYLALKWIAWHIVRPTHLKDRWGFNLGEDMHDWLSMRLFMYLRKLEKAAHLYPVELTTGPRPQSWITLPGGGTSSAGTSTTVKWSTWT